MEGVKPVAELLKSDLEIHFLVGLEERVEGLGEERKDVELIATDRRTLESCSTLQHPEGIMALAGMPSFAFDAKELPRDRPLLAFEGLSDPGNLGTLLRLADHFDLRDLLLAADSVDPYNPKVVRSSMGSLFRQRAHQQELHGAIEALRGEGRTIVATDMGGPSVHSHPLPQDAVLLFGSESHGLSEGMKERADLVRGLPALGKVESLNVAISAGIFCSELLREALG